MRKPDFANLWVQIVGAKGHAGAMMRIVLTAAGVGHVVQIKDSRHALSLLFSQHFDAVFVEETHLDSLNFDRSARRRTVLRNPLILIFAVYSGARRCDMARARNLGVTSVICRPVSPRTIFRQIALHVAEASALYCRAGFLRPRPPCQKPGVAWCGAQQAHTQKIQDPGGRLTFIHCRSVSMSKIEVGKFGLYQEVFDFDEVASSSLCFVKLAAERSGVRLTKTVAREAARLFADKCALTPVLVNLLSNAIKFTPRGGQVMLESALGRAPPSRSSFLSPAWIEAVCKRRGAWCRRPRRRERPA